MGVDASQDKTPGSIRVVLVDDHEVVRVGIHNMLRGVAGVTIVGEARDGEEAIERIQALAPDVVLMDLKMPRLDGVGSIRQMRKLGLNTPVILLSAYYDEEYVFEGLRAGARGYLPKDVDRRELVLAIRTVHEGGSSLQLVMVQRLIETLAAESGKSLTKREREVLALLGSGARNKEIANRLYLSVNTIKFHIENIYQKLGVRSRTQASRVANERGLLDN